MGKKRFQIGATKPTSEPLSKKPLLQFQRSDQAIMPEPPDAMPGDKRIPWQPHLEAGQSSGPQWHQEEQEHRLPSSEIYFTVRAILTGSLSFASLPTREVEKVLKGCITEIRRRLYQIEIEVTKLKQEVNDERQARARAEALVREVAANGQQNMADTLQQASLAAQKLISTEAELEATRRSLEGERERCKRIQSEASERQKEAVLAQKTSLQELDKERQARAHAEVYAREVAAKAQDEVAEAIKQASISVQKLSAAETKLEATHRALAEERERCEQIKSEASEKQREALLAQQTSYQELVRAEASAREAAAKAQEEIAQATENARRTTQKLSATEVELEASRQALDEEREQCKRIQCQASEKLEEALRAQKTSIQELDAEKQARACAEASARETAAKARDEVAEAVKKSILDTQKLIAAEAELEATRKALVEEREHCQRIQSEASEKQKELLLAQKMSFQELGDERQAWALAEASAREAAAKAQEERAEAVKQASLATMLLSAADAELEATCQALDEERENSKRIKTEASEKQESLFSQNFFFKKLNEERKARICTEKWAREAAAKARDEIAKAVRQSSLATQKLSAAEAELESTRQALAEESQRYQRIQSEFSKKQKEALLAQRTSFLKQIKAQVETAEEALHWDTK
uniref:Uncharacterized protein n=1 Tax=Vitis vinifera TaxID=29760 RepID=A5C293_VITVI|nr:hypothetical protein VITISV_028943 [Vitis vinifera]